MVYLIQNFNINTKYKFYGVSFSAKMQLNADVSVNQ